MCMYSHDKKVTILSLSKPKTITNKQKKQETTEPQETKPNETQPTTQQKHIMQ